MRKSRHRETGQKDDPQLDSPRTVNHVRETWPLCLNTCNDPHPSWRDSSPLLFPSTQTCSFPGGRRWLLTRADGSQCGAGAPPAAGPGRAAHRARSSFKQSRSVVLAPTCCFTNTESHVKCVLCRLRKGCGAEPGCHTTSFNARGAGRGSERAQVRTQLQS